MILSILVDSMMSMFGTKRTKAVQEQERTLTQKAIADFEGDNYYSMTSDRAEIVEAMMDLGYVEVDPESGNVELTARGSGILKGSIKTNNRTPRFLSGYNPPEA